MLNLGVKGVATVLEQKRTAASQRRQSVPEQVQLPQEPAQIKLRGGIKSPKKHSRKSPVDVQIVQLGVTEAPQMQIAEQEAVKITIQSKKSFRRLELTAGKIETVIQTADALQRNRDVMIDLDQVKEDVSQAVSQAGDTPQRVTDKEGEVVKKKKKRKQNVVVPVILNGPVLEQPPQVWQKKIVINTSRSEYPLIDQVAREKFGWRVSKEEDPTKGDFDLWWSDLLIEGSFLASLRCYQKVNHFPAMFQIARKTFLARNLKRLQKLYPIEFSFFPKTWILPNEINDLRFAQEQTYSKLAKPEKESKKERKPVVPNQQKRPKAGFTMICKPDWESQGKGIFLTHDIDQIPTVDLHVVQEYLSHPYLIDGLKFDMRIYVLIFSCEPLKIFLHKEGLVRFATQPYVPIDIHSGRDQMQNMFVHLTNYALNKDNGDFKMPESVNDNTAHKRSITSLNKTLRSQGKDVDKMWAEIKDLIIKTMLTIQPELAHSYRMCQPSDQESLMCFELLGFDVILTHDMRPMLLEVNHAPSFATDSPLDLDIKKQLFEDMFGMLGLSIERKREKLQDRYDDKVNRMTTKLSLKEKNKLKKQIIEEQKIAQDKIELEQSGDFEKIFPLNIEGAKVEFEKARQDQSLSVPQKQVFQQQYHSLVRSQERYDEFLNTILSNEHEKAARQKIKMEENEKKECEKTQAEIDKAKEKKKKDKHKLEQFKALTQRRNRSFHQSDQQVNVEKFQITEDNRPNDLIDRHPSNNTSQQSVQDLHHQKQDTLTSMIVPNLKDYSISQLTHLRVNSGQLKQKERNSSLQNFQSPVGLALNGQQLTLNYYSSQQNSSVHQSQQQNFNMGQLKQQPKITQPRDKLPFIEGSNHFLPKIFKGPSHINSTNQTIDDGRGMFEEFQNQQNISSPRNNSKLNTQQLQNIMDSIYKIDSTVQSNKQFQANPVSFAHANKRVLQQVQFFQPLNSAFSNTGQIQFATMGPVAGNLNNVSLARRVQQPIHDLRISTDEKTKPISFNYMPLVLTPTKQNKPKPVTSAAIIDEVITKMQANEKHNFETMAASPDRKTHQRQLPVNSVQKQSNISPGLIIFQSKQHEQPYNHINVTIINNNHYYPKDSSTIPSSPKPR